MEVRQIAVSADGRRAAFGAFSKHVEIWDLDSGSAASAFGTTLDFGGQRLAMNANGSIVVTAAYERDGIAAYDADNGKLLWRRSDLTRVQYLTTSPRTHQIYAGFESGPGCVLDERTGKTLSRQRGVRRFAESPYRPMLLLDGDRAAVSLIASLKRLFTIQRSTFAFLSAAFAPSQLAISEAGGDVRCLALCDGSPRWTFEPPAGVHCLDLTYSEADDAFFGILWAYRIGGDKELVRFAGDGSARLIANIGRPAETAFSLTTPKLVTSDRRIIDILTGAFSDLPPRQ